MTYYYTCEYCGANLDPDEKCDCRQEPEAQKEGADPDPDVPEEMDPE